MSTSSPSDTYSTSKYKSFFECLIDVNNAPCIHKLNSVAAWLSEACCASNVSLPGIYWIFVRSKCTLSLNLNRLTGHSSIILSCCYPPCQVQDRETHIFAAFTIGQPLGFDSTFGIIRIKQSLVTNDFINFFWTILPFQKVGSHFLMVPGWS